MSIINKVLKKYNSTNNLYKENNNLLKLKNNLKCFNINNNQIKNIENKKLNNIKNNSNIDLNKELNLKIESNSLKKNYLKDKKIDEKNNFINSLNLKNISELNIEDIHEIINKNNNLEQNKIIINFILQLNPFYYRLSKNFPQKSKNLIKKIIPEYKSNFYNKNTILFKYGDEADNFYIIHQGQIDILFPLTEFIQMSLDEYVIYLLKLRRFNEIEILNNVLLLNYYIFFFNFNSNFDNWLKKAFKTLLIIKYNLSFLKENKKQYYIKNYNNIYSYDYEFKIENINKNNNQIFNDKETKDLIFRLEKEIILTIKICFPEIYREVIIEPIYNKHLIVKVFINKNEINNYIKINSYYDYINRISPEIKNNSNNENKKQITIIKYQYLKTLKKGEFFGDILLNKSKIFNDKQINIMKNSSKSSYIKIHQNFPFRTYSVIIKEETYLGCISKNIYFEYLKTFSEKNLIKKTNFILNNNFFKNCNILPLLKSYIYCFIKKKLNVGELLINQNEKLNLNDFPIYFIKKGEFQMKCFKSINQIDEALKILGKNEDEINENYPKVLNNIYDSEKLKNLKKNPFEMKLNFIKEEEIVGLFDLIISNKFFNDVICTKKASVYFVSSNLIKYFINSDEIISKKKNILLINKNNVLCEILLNIRKNYFNRYLINEKSTNIKIEFNKTKNITRNTQKNNQIITKYLSQKNERKTEKKEKKEKFFISLGDLDILLAKTSSKLTLEDKMIKRHLDFKKKYFQKLKNKKFKRIKSSENIFKEKSLSSKIKELIPNLNVNKNIDNENNINIDLKDKNYFNNENKITRSNSYIINPLTYDDFNRNYNYTNYFKLFKSNSETKLNSKKENLNIHLNLKQIPISIINNYYSNKKFFQKNIFPERLLNQQKIINNKLKRIYFGKFDKIINNNFENVN